MNEFGDLERRLAARVSAPDPALRARVLGALERERRGERQAWFSAAAACWLVVGAAWWSAGGSPRPETASPSVTELLARGPDLAHVPRLALPLAPDGSVTR